MTVSTVFDTVAMIEEYFGIGVLEGIASGSDQLERVAMDLAAQG